MSDSLYSFTQSPCEISSLTLAIESSSIVTALDYIQIYGAAVDVYFKAALSSGDQTTLAALVAANTGVPTPSGPQPVTISTLPAAPAFATNALGNKALYVAMTGVQQALTTGSNTILFTIPYAQAQISGIDIIACEALDTASFYVLDSTSGTYSGTPNAVLNQFGYTANLPAALYTYRAPYTANLYENMQIKVVYNSISNKTVGINFDLNQVK